MFKYTHYFHKLPEHNLNLIILILSNSVKNSNFYDTIPKKRQGKKKKYLYKN